MKTLFFCNLIPLKTGAFETLLAAIGREFKKAGDEFVIVFAGEPIAPVAESLRAEGVRWHVISSWAQPRRRLPVTGCQLSVSKTNNQEPITENRTGERVRPWAFVLPSLRLIRRERPDVVAVHFGNELPTLVASLLCKVLTRKPPRWVWEQDQQIQDPGRISRWLSKIRFLGLGVDQYLAVYEGGRESMLKRGIPGHKIAVIHNSVAPYTPTRPKGWLRRELSVNGYSLSVNKTNNQEPITNNDVADILLVTNGSLIPRKRIDFILRACGRLKNGADEKSIEQKNAKEEGDAFQCGRRTPCGDSAVFAPKQEQSPHGVRLPHSEPSGSNVDGQWSMVASSPLWRLLVIGEGPERDNLMALAGELGISERVFFLGLRNDVREILSECDIYLHASKAETCTYAVTESMAAGIPAVMLKAGAAKEQITNGETGFVFDEADIEPFAACLGALMRDPVRRAEMGRLARLRWESKFMVARAAGLYHGLYRKLV